MDNTAVAPANPAEASRPAKRHALMHLVMLFTTGCWAANMIAIKEATRGLSALAVVQVRMAAAALILAVVFGVTRLGASRPRSSLRRSARPWGTLALLALSGVGFNQLFFTAGVARTSVAHASLIVALGPVMVLVFATLLQLEALTVSKFLGMLIAFAGVAILTSGKAAGSGSHWHGDLIVLAGSAVFAYYTIAVKEVSQQYDPLTLNALIYTLGTLLFAPLGARAALTAPWGAVSSHVAWAIAYMVIFGSVVPYTLFAYAMTELSAARVAAFGYLQPVMATMLGIWLLGEKLTRGVILGGAIILLGVYLTERERGEEAA